MNGPGTNDRCLNAPGTNADVPSHGARRDGGRDPGLGEGRARAHRTEANAHSHTHTDSRADTPTDTRTEADTLARIRALAKGRGRPRRPSGGMLPRTLPWDSAMTRMWPGTKVLCLTALSSALLLRPRWSTLAAVGLVLLVGSLTARVPLRALPRLPVWFWSGIAGGMIGASLGGGLWIFVRSLVVAALVVWGSMLLIWSTPPERLTPAFRSLMAPMRWFSLPVDEWATSMGLALRGIPSLRDEAAAVMDTARLRSGGTPPDGLKAGLRLMVDVITAALSASSRRASDTGRAMTLRGGVPPVPREHVRLGWRDGIALVLTGVAVGLVVAVAMGAVPDPFQALGPS